MELEIGQKVFLVNYDDVYDSNGDIADWGTYGLRSGTITRLEGKVEERIVIENYHTVQVQLDEDGDCSSYCAEFHRSDLYKTKDEARNELIQHHQGRIQKIERIIEKIKGL